MGLQLFYQCLDQCRYLRKNLSMQNLRVNTVAVIRVVQEEIDQHLQSWE